MRLEEESKGNKKAKEILLPSSIKVIQNLTLSTNPNSTLHHGAHRRDEIELPCFGYIRAARLEVLGHATVRFHVTDMENIEEDDEVGLRVVAETNVF